MSASRTTHAPVAFSLTTMLGLVSHGAAVERNWFQHYLGGKPREEITGKRSWSQRRLEPAP